MTDLNTVSFATATTGLALTAVFSIPAVLNLVKNFTEPREKKDTEGIYEDEDGSATKESQEKFSNTLPKISIAVVSVLGFGVSLALAVLNTLHLANDGLFIEDWEKVGAWVRTIAESIQSLQQD